MTIISLPVRKATVEYREPILDLCRQNHAENGQFGLSMPKVEAMLDRAFNREGAIIGIVGGHNSVEGAILLSINQFWYTDEWCLEEIFNYVRPEFRRSTNAKDMIDFAKRCSDELCIPLIIGVVSNERTRAKIELYRRRLGDPVGGYFLHRPASAGQKSA